MAINETIVTGRKLRKCINAATKQWQRFSIWSKASDTEFNDGKTAETKVGAIDGITDSLASTSSRVAASAKALNTINAKIAVKANGTGYTDLSLKAALTKYLTFSNIPIHQSRTFYLNTKDGHYIGNATAWNGDWISGYAVRGSANTDTIDAYCFTRFVSQGADTVLKKLGSQPFSARFYLGYIRGAGQNSDSSHFSGTGNSRINLDVSNYDKVTYSNVAVTATFPLQYLPP